jgi:predicted nucleic acid-binding protein
MPRSPCVDTSSILRISRQHQLSSYDAAYLDLARVEGLPLATLDKNLRTAERRSGVELVSPGKTHRL